MSLTHEPDCEGFADKRGEDEGVCRSFCVFHSACEPKREGDYRLCGECFHIFRTEKELLDEFNYEYEGPKQTNGDAVFFCPLCIHDF